VLRTRLILGTITIGAIIGLAFLDNALEPHIGAGFVFFVVFCLLGAIGALELSRMLQSRDIPASPWVLITGALIGLTATILPILDPTMTHPWIVLPTAASIVLMLQAIDLIRMRHVDHASACLASSQLSVVYLGVLPAFFILMCHEHGPFMVLAIVLVTKSCDIGAYFLGTAFGKHKLIPWLSPAKSWEGLIGGALCSALFGAMAVLVFADSTSMPLWYTAIGGLALGVFGQGGDLVESLLKRSAGVKDSGVIPGFGGVLDMIDSPILVAPIAYWLLEAAPAI
jgi:phosphatidate cytidylyltransferase